MWAPSLSPWHSAPKSSQNKKAGEIHLQRGLEISNGPQLIKNKSAFAFTYWEKYPLLLLENAPLKPAFSQFSEERALTPGIVQSAPLSAWPWLMVAQWLSPWLSAAITLCIISGWDFIHENSKSYSYKQPFCFLLEETVQLFVTLFSEILFLY